MNTSIILRKCLAELGKEKPSMDYLRGMLETLVELNNVPQSANSTPQFKPSEHYTVSTMPTPAPNAVDEAQILDNLARAGIGKMKKSNEP